MKTDETVTSETQESPNSFKPASLETAQTLLAELDWGKHFVGAEMNPASGSRQVYIYSLKEAAQFLRNGTAGMGFTGSGRSTISWIDVQQFIDWARNGLGDEELAQALEEGIVGEETFYSQVQKIGYLVDARYAQLKQLIDENDCKEEQDGEAILA